MQERNGVMLLDIFSAHASEAAQSNSNAYLREMDTVFRRWTQNEDTLLSGEELIDVVFRPIYSSYNPMSCSSELALFTSRKKKDIFKLWRDWESYWRALKW